MRIPRARLIRVVVAVVVALAIGPTRPAPLGATGSKLDQLLQARPPFGRSHVILRVTTPQALSGVIWLAQLLGGIVLRQLPVINAVALDVPNAVLPTLAASPVVERISLDRKIAAANERTAATVGATAVRSRLGLDGSGVGIAIVDSGAMVSHDDLAAGGGPNRIDRFVDFTSSQTNAYDDSGHGTHVAGIIAGNGVDSSGARSGIAPNAHLTVLKALDDEGRGRISDVIAAIGYAVSHRTELNIRVLNLSVAAGVYESYSTDPLTLAAREAVEDGIVVVAAAGNNGRGPQGQTRYGGITAPGNAPWVLTVGASSHMGTVARGDDTIAVFSSRGPTAIDATAKPDLVSPGVGIESLSDPLGSLYVTNAAGLLPGTVTTPYLPYMSLSGTSMSAPVVSGTVALMLQANPALTPNAVKAILQFTAQTYAGYDSLTQGAGFLNADGAVSLAAWFAAPTTTPYPDASTWSGHLLWGTRILEGPGVTADAVPWAANVTWGDPSQFASLANVVWGSLCGGANCEATWNNQNVTTTNDEDGETVVWGTNDEDGETVVWGTSCTDPGCETVVWGSQ
jgi:serine protease AprX